MGNIEPKIEESWKSRLKDEFRETYFSELKTFLENEKSTIHRRTDHQGIEIGGNGSEGS